MKIETGEVYKTSDGYWEVVRVSEPPRPLAYLIRVNAFQQKLGERKTVPLSYLADKTNVTRRDVPSHLDPH